MRVPVLVLVVLIGAAPAASRDPSSDPPVGRRATAASSAEPAPVGKLAYAASGGEKSATLLVVNGDGTARRRLADVPMYEPWLAWSPDGTRIMVADSDLDGPLLLVRADGGGRRRLATGAQSPAWSPDGKHVAFRRSLDMYVVATDRVPRLRRLGTAVYGGGWIAAWSPDGRRLAFGVSHGIAIVDVTTGVRDMLPTSSAGPGHLAWSPDGTTLAFIGRGVLFLMIMGPDGLVEKKVIGDVDDLEDVAPSWSPDGRRLLFTRSVYGEWSGVFTVAADGRGLRRLVRTTGLGAVSSPSWSPDGRHIAFKWTRFAEFDGYGGDVFVMRADGRGATPLTTAAPEDLDYGPPSWTAGRLAGTTPKHGTRTPAVSAGRLIAANGIVEALAADEGLVAFARRGTADDSCTLTTANRGLGARTYAGIGGGSETCVDGLAIAGIRVYWTSSYQEGHSLDTDELWTRTLDGHPRSIWHVNRSGWQPLYGGNLHGDSSVVVHNTWFHGRRGVTAAKLWRLDGERRVVVGQGSRSFPVLAAASGRVAVLGSRNLVAILDTNGRQVIRLDLGPGRLLGAAISAGRLVALRSSSLEAYDLATKRRVAVRPVSPASDLRLHDAERDLVVYSKGLELTVLDLRSGRRLAVALPEHAGPIGAALTTAGLYVAYNVPRVPSPGRIGFVPRQRLAARLR